MTNPAFRTLLIDAITRTIPADADQDAAAREAGLTMARMLLEAWQPADAMEAALAARAIAGHLAAMDSFARAAKPGVSDEKAIRLRANAIAAGRIFDRQFQALRRQRQPAPDRATTANSGAAAARARRGADPPLPVPGVFDAVTRALRRASLCDSTALAPVQPTVLAPG